jgi:transposase-like protein
LSVRSKKLAMNCHILAVSPLQWKALRTTNALEGINEEFRRRTKTQASLPGEDAVLMVLYGLLRSGSNVYFGASKAGMICPRQKLN